MLLISVCKHDIIGRHRIKGRTLKKIRVYTAEHHNPWFNLATEDWLFKNFPEDEHLLFLWRNHPCIVIGRFQNPWMECDLEKMKNNDIFLSRRQSGGGAVYHDLGNTNFTFMSPASHYSDRRNFSIILGALEKLGITGEVSGRNDLLVDGKKFSGSAFKKNKQKAFHHGTLLINADLSGVSSYLTPDKDKLISKGIRSVASRVTNLHDIVPGVTHESITEAIIEEFFETYGERVEVEDLSIDRLSQERSLYETYKTYSSWQWLYGSSPKFTHPISQRFDWGGIAFDLKIESGVIHDLEIASDALSVEFIEYLQKVLPGTTYTQDAVYHAVVDNIASLLSEDYHGMAKDVAGLLQKEAK